MNALRTIQPDIPDLQAQHQKEINRINREMLARNMKYLLPFSYRYFRSNKAKQKYMAKNYIIQYVELPEGLWSIWLSDRKYNVYDKVITDIPVSEWSIDSSVQTSPSI